MTDDGRAEAGAQRAPRAQQPALPTLQRDRPLSPFGAILTRFVEVHPGCLAAVFVDVDGECVDYASRLDVFDALILGAQLCPVTHALETLSRQRGGGLVLWVVEAAQRDIVVRRVTDELTVVVALSAGSLGARLLRAMAALAEALRREAGLETPSWEPGGDALSVRLRPAAGWGYAPAALIGSDGTAQPVEVLGRWTEHGSISTREVVCFRVRCGTDELTLSHDLSLDRWQRR